MDFIHLTLIDLIDIVVVGLLFYQVYRLIRGTAAMTIFAGIFIVYLLWIVVRALNMDLLSSILGQVIGLGVLALVIVFQQEVRRYLLLLGSRVSNTRNRFVRSIFKSARTGQDLRWVEELARACRNMAFSKTGALICIERQGELSVYASTGEPIDAQIRARLLESIFFKNSPLHDGAVILRGGRIYASRCILPTSDNPYVPKYYGMRHRAALGLTEHSDAIVVVVSEERGSISLVQGGEIMPVRNPDELERRITELLTGERESPSDEAKPTRE